ncbi:hypothetical protein [Streptomyces sp. NBC_00648]
MSEEEAITRKLMDRVEISEYAEVTYQSLVNRRRKTASARSQKAAS